MKKRPSTDAGSLERSEGQVNRVSILSFWLIYIPPAPPPLPIVLKNSLLTYDTIFLAETLVVFPSSFPSLLLYPGFCDSLRAYIKLRLLIWMRRPTDSEFGRFAMISTLWRQSLFYYSPFSAITQCCIRSRNERQWNATNLWIFLYEYVLIWQYE